MTVIRRNIIWVSLIFLTYCYPSNIVPCSNHISECTLNVNVPNVNPLLNKRGSHTKSGIPSCLKLGSYNSLTFSEVFVVKGFNETLKNTYISVKCSEYTKSIREVISIQNEKSDATINSLPVPNSTSGCYSSAKTYMPYTAVTNRSSNQYKLLNSKDAYTDKNGLRKVRYDDGDRYCVALGSYYTTKIGTKFNLILDNGNVIRCVLADQKADCHTDPSNRFTADGSVAEFIVDYDVFLNVKDAGGTVNWVDGFEGKIVSIYIVE